jgi:hypothetical protein
LHQGETALTPEMVAMLATCSDQANKAKLMAAKGRDDADPLKVVREFEARLLVDVPSPPVPVLDEPRKEQKHGTRTVRAKKQTARQASHPVRADENGAGEEQ